MPGSRSCRPRTSSRSTPRPTASTRCSADLVGLSFSVEPGKAAYLPLAHELSGRAGAARSQRRRWPRSRRCSPMPAGRSSASTASTTCTCCAGTASPCAGYADDTMLESFVLNSGSSRHDMDSLAKRYLGYDTIKYEDVAGKGSQADRVLAGRARRRHALRGRGRRHHAAPASRAGTEARRGTAPGGRLPRHRDAAGAGARAHRGQRRAHRWRRAAPAVRRSRPAHAQRAAEGDRAGRDAPSTSIRPSSCARCCSKN